jgi:hypothetical protein
MVLSDLFTVAFQSDSLWVPQGVALLLWIVLQDGMLNFKLRSALLTLYEVKDVKLLEKPRIKFQKNLIRIADAELDETRKDIYARISKEIDNLNNEDFMSLINEIIKPSYTAYIQEVAPRPPNLKGEITPLVLEKLREGVVIEPIPNKEDTKIVTPKEPEVKTGIKVPPQVFKVKVPKCKSAAPMQAELITLISSLIGEGDEHEFIFKDQSIVNKIGVQVSDTDAKALDALKKTLLLERKDLVQRQSLSDMQRIAYIDSTIDQVNRSLESFGKGQPIVLGQTSNVLPGEQVKFKVKSENREILRGALAQWRSNYGPITGQDFSCEYIEASISSYLDPVIFTGKVKVKLDRASVSKVNFTLKGLPQSLLLEFAHALIDRGFSVDTNHLFSMSSYPDEFVTYLVQAPDISKFISMNLKKWKDEKAKKEPSEIDKQLSIVWGQIDSNTQAKILETNHVNDWQIMPEPWKLALLDGAKEGNLAGKLGIYLSGISNPMTIYEGKVNPQKKVKAGEVLAKKPKPANLSGVVNDALMAEWFIKNKKAIPGWIATAYRNNATLAIQAISWGLTTQMSKFMTTLPGWRKSSTLEEFFLLNHIKQSAWSEDAFRLFFVEHWNTGSLNAKKLKLFFEKNGEILNVQNLRDARLIKVEGGSNPLSRKTQGPKNRSAGGRKGANQRTGGNNRAKKAQNNRDSTPKEQKPETSTETGNKGGDVPPPTNTGGSVSRTLRIAGRDYTVGDLQKKVKGTSGQNLLTIDGVKVLRSILITAIQSKGWVGEIRAAPQQRPRTPPGNVPRGNQGGTGRRRRPQRATK